MLIFIVICGILAGKISAQGYYQSSQTTTTPPPNSPCVLTTVVTPVTGPPNKYIGDWYAYRSTFPSVNGKVVYNFIANSWDGHTDKPAVNTWFTMTYHRDNATQTCDNSLFIGQITTGGAMQGRTSDTHFPDIIEIVNHWMMYIDDSFHIMYRCLTANHQNGTCLVPLIQVNTRMRWDQMDSSTLAGIDSTIDSVFAKFCMTAAQIPRQAQGVTNLPNCPPVVPVDDASKLIKGLSVTWTCTGLATPSQNCSYQPLP